MNSVIIVEDNDQVRESMTTFIEADQSFLLLGAYNNAEDGLKAMASEPADLVLMDIGLPGMDGVSATREIKKEFPQALVIIVTVFEQSETVFDALCAGAVGYLTKDFTPEKLIGSLKEAVAGGAPMSSRIASMVVRSFQKNLETPLTDRETEVLQGLSDGRSYNSIGESLFISKDTVKYHIKKFTSSFK